MGLLVELCSSSPPTIHLFASDGICRISILMINSNMVPVLILKREISCSFVNSITCWCTFLLTWCLKLLRECEKSSKTLLLCLLSIQTLASIPVTRFPRKKHNRSNIFAMLISVTHFRTKSKSKAVDSTASPFDSKVSS